ATYRDDELAADHPLRVMLGDLATQRAIRRMRLPPLSEEAVRALVGRREVDAGELYRVTGGNPFYVSEIMEAGWPSVPPTHREAAAQFERALRFAGEGDGTALAALHEGAAGEYSLLDRWEEAERALRIALRLRRQLGDDLSAGRDLRRLCTTLWRLCRGEESGQAAGEA